MKRNRNDAVTSWTPESLQADLDAGRAEVVRETRPAKIVITARVDGSMVDELTEIAAAQGMRPTALIRQYIEAGLAADRRREDVPSLIQRVQADVAKLARAVQEPPQAA